MAKQQIFTNANLVTRDDCFRGSLCVEDGKISEISRSNSNLPQAIDLAGDYLIPGLIELHTDNQEKYFTPRPGVDWPARMAMATHDAQLVASGITTVFDAVALGDIIGESTRIEKLDAIIEAVVESVASCANRADHFLHLRCELSCPETLDFFRRFVDTAGVRLVSLMDHAPGQRQFPPENIPKYREYYQTKYGMSDAEMDRFIELQQANSAKYSDAYRREIVGICQARGIATASHDDATAAHARESAAFGMSIAEFPTTLEAARLSHELGLKVLMGAPNVVRGGSHSGNIAAKELARHGCLDILSSDYYPASLVQGAFLVAEDLDNSYSLPQAIALVTANPAEAAGLTDRGELAVGKRADLVRIDHNPRLHLIREVYNAGNRVF